MFNKILVPLDGSQLAEQVLPYATMLAQRRQAVIILLRVANHPARQYYVEGLAVNAAQSDDSPAHCEAYLRHMAESLTTSDVVVSYVVREGAIADVILDYADEVRADLIAMATHGRTGIGRWWMGSVADRVAHGSPTPILLIRDQPVKSAIAAQVEEQFTSTKTDLPIMPPFSPIH